VRAERARDPLGRRQRARGRLAAREDERPGGSRLERARYLIARA
jgi:hypothetical protein